MISVLLLPLYASTLKGGFAESPSQLLKRVEGKVAALHGVNADIVETHTWMHQDGAEVKTTHQETTDLKLSYARPNRFVIVSKTSGRPESNSTVSDGKALHRFPASSITRIRSARMRGATTGTTTT